MIPWVWQGYLMVQMFVIWFYSFLFRRKLLYDALNELEETGDLDSDFIYLMPPDAAEESDEYSGDETEDEPRDLNHLPARQLRAEVEIGPGENSDEEEMVTSAPTRRGRGRRPEGETWKIKKTTTKGQALFPEKNLTKYKDFSPSEVFDLFLDDDILEMILHQSTLYAQKKSGMNLDISKNELKVFISVLLLSGYVRVPQKRMYWESSSDTFNQAVSSAIRRNRFETIMRYLHFQDQINVEDRWTKVRPLADKMRRNFLKHFVPGRFISHDETMIKFFGRSALKQSIRIKPIRFGFKVWCANDPSGYLIDFILYQGKTFVGDGNAELDTEFGKCSATVLHLADHILKEDHCKNLPFHFMMDNLFTTPQLLRALNERCCEGTGTVRQNRIRGDPLPSKETLNKSARGTFASAETTDGVLKYSKWKDNQVVSVLSTVYGIEKQDVAKRWSRDQNKYVQIPRPSSVANYNSNMGGTDRMGQNVNKYRISIHQKKTYWHVFTWLLDVAVQNAWNLFREAGGDISLLRFRREIAMHHLKAFGTAALPRGPRQSRVAEGARFEGRDHWPKILDGTSRKRCSDQQCPKRDQQNRGPLSRYACTRCNVGLCIDPCFRNFHEP